MVLGVGDSERGQAPPGLGAEDAGIGDPRRVPRVLGRPAGAPFRVIELVPDDPHHLLAQGGEPGLGRGGRGLGSKPEEREREDQGECPERRLG